MRKEFEVLEHHADMRAQLNALFVEWGSLTRQADCCVLWTNGEGQVEIECTAGVPELALFQLWDLHQFYYCQAKILADFP
jgi:hypothetical protein